MIKGYFYLALSFILSLMFSCSQEVKFVVDIEKAFYEVSTRSENLLQKSGFEKIRKTKDAYLDTGNKNRYNIAVMEGIVNWGSFNVNNLVTISNLF